MPDGKSAEASAKILYSSEMLRNEIRHVLAEPRPGDRRVALVAYIGGHAESFLPDPYGLQIVCALQPGSTDPVTLGRLKNRKAVLFKSDRLHMKVYWSSRNGCVICSANASDNALGGGHLREAGAWFPPGTVDIERLWRYADPKPLEDVDLKWLSKAARKWTHRSPVSGLEARAPDFLEWLSLPGRTDWKLGWWRDAGTVKLSQAAMGKAKSYAVTEPVNFIPVSMGQAAEGDWFLQFDIDSAGTLSWMCTDFVVEVEKSEREACNSGYPYQAVQLHPLKRYPPRPFLLDRNFKEAFKVAVESYGAENIELLKSLTPPSQLIQLIKENWPARGRLLRGSKSSIPLRCIRLRRTQ